MSTYCFGATSGVCGRDWAKARKNGRLLLENSSSGEQGKIRLLPAWPADWNVDFKLHTPHQTVVEGKVRGGKVIQLNVTPESRRDDVIYPDCS